MILIGVTYRSRNDSVTSASVNPPQHGDSSPKLGIWKALHSHVLYRLLSWSEPLLVSLADLVFCPTLSLGCPETFLGNSGCLVSLNNPYGSYTLGKGGA